MTGESEAKPSHAACCHTQQVLLSIYVFHRTARRTSGHSHDAFMSVYCLLHVVSPSNSPLLSFFLSLFVSLILFALIYSMSCRTTDGPFHCAANEAHVYHLHVRH